MARGINPYAKPSYQEGKQVPNPSGVYRLGGYPRYAVPDIPETTDPENTDGGFSPELRVSSDGTALPDDIRIGVREPPPNDPNVKSYTALRDAEKASRLSVEETETSWNVQQHKVPAGQNPMWNQEREPIRPSARRSPLGYLFQRPWHIPRNVKDALGEDATAHFSMADHRRAYQVYGMAPRGGVGVNTYRLEPRPWDQNLVARPPSPESGEPGKNLVGGNRNYRL